MYCSVNCNMFSRGSQHLTLDTTVLYDILTKNVRQASSIGNRGPENDEFT